MTRSDRDPTIDAFERRLATVERFIPARPPALGQTLDPVSIRVVGGTAFRRPRRKDSTMLARAMLAPVGIAAAAVIAIVGISLLTGPAIGPGATSSPVPSPSPTRTRAALCAAPLDAASPQPLRSDCRYRSTGFQPPVELEVSSGWTKVIDSAGEVSIQDNLSAAPKPDIGTLTIAALDNVVKSPCAATGIAGPTRPWTPATAASGPQELMDWIESDTGVPHSPPSPVTIDGHAGLETTLSPGLGSLGQCAGVAFLSDLGGARGHVQIRENEGMRLDAIEVGGRTILIVAQVPRAVLMGDFLAKVDGLLLTLSFG